MLLDYDQHAYHVGTRQGLPPSVKQTLLEAPRSEWQNHPRFGGKAKFFTTVLSDLIVGAAQLLRGIEQLLDVPRGDIDYEPRSQAARFWVSSVRGRRQVNRKSWPRARGQMKERARVCLRNFLCGNRNGGERRGR